MTERYESRSDAFNPTGLRLRYSRAIAILHAVDIDADTRVIVFGDPDNGSYEWGIERKGKIEQHSDVGYGNLPAALRDGLMTAWPPRDDGLTPHCSARSEKGDTIPVAEIEEQIEHIKQNGIDVARFGGEMKDEGRCRELCAMYLREFIHTRQLGRALELYPDRIEHHEARAKEVREGKRRP